MEDDEHSPSAVARDDPFVNNEYDKNIANFPLKSSYGRIRK
jgi:hypothetical protein